MISIIIPTLNRSKELGENLYRLISYIKDPDLFEIIIIDNGSKDNTSEVVKNLTKISPEFNVKYIFDSEPGLLTGRHRGFQESSGSILAFIDDDILISETWLPFLRELQNSFLEFGFFTGPNLPLYSAYPPDWIQYFWRQNHLDKECSWLSLMDFGNEPKEVPLVYVWGLNFIVRRDIFMTSGGFNPDNISTQYQHFQGDGETGLSFKAFKLGSKALYHPSLLVYHQIGKERLTKAYFGKRSYYQGVCNSFTQLRGQHLTSDIDILSTHPTPIQVNKRNWKGLIVDRFPIIRPIVKLIKRFILKQPVKIQVPDNSEYFAILQHTNDQYQLGFEFHQNAFRSNPLVREWVVRENYWDYRNPQKND